MLGKGVNEIGASRRKNGNFKGFFKKISKRHICFFCPWRQQNYHICHSDRVFNAHQIEISVEHVSMAKGCPFTYRSCFYSMKEEERGEVISIEEERATNTCR